MRPFLKIEGDLAIHLARLELAEAIFAVVDAQRAYLRTWLPWVDATKSVEDTKVFLRESMLHNKEGTRLTTFILNGEEIAGSIGVVHFNRDHRKCEIGYWLREDLQGNGVMTKSCTCFIDYLFRRKNLNRIEVCVAAGNIRSKRVPQRLGFRCEGTLLQSLVLYGEFHDLEIFAMLRQDWLAGAH